MTWKVCSTQIVSLISSTLIRQGGKDFTSVLDKSAEKVPFQGESGKPGHIFWGQVGINQGTPGLGDINLSYSIYK